MPSRLNHGETIRPTLPTRHRPRTSDRFDRASSPARAPRVTSGDVACRVSPLAPRVTRPRDHREVDHTEYDNVVDLQAARLERLYRLESAPRDNFGEAEIAPHVDETASEAPRAPCEKRRRGLFGGVRRAAGPSTEDSSKIPCAPCHWGLVVLTLVLSLLSVPLIYSASTAIALDHHGRTDFFLLRQIGFVGAGLLVLLGASLVSPRQLRVLVWVLYVVTLVGLALTDFTPLGLNMGGVRRWLKLGPIPIQLQFSELAKIALIGVLADFWSRSARIAPRSIWPWIGSACLTLPLVGLVFLQPHLSAASLLFVLPFCIAFYAGAAWQTMARIVMPLAVLAVVVVVLCGTHSMPGLKTYQQDRIAAHFGAKGHDEQGSNYQALQGQRALVRGGLFGAGPGGSLYKQGHLPAPHTDFIVAIIGEEWGLAGMLALMLMYGLMIFFCFHTGYSACCPFEAVLCAGIGTLFSIQLVGNLGVVTGVLPVTGMPLPLLSYGGSGLLCALLGLGLVLSVSRRYGMEVNVDPASTPIAPGRERAGVPSKAYSGA